MSAGFLVRLRESRAELTEAEARVADYVAEHVQQVAGMPITVLAQRSASSEATVVRLCKKLHLRGYQELRLALAQEASTLRLEDIHEDVTLGDSPATVLAKVFTGIGQALQDTRDIADEGQLQQAIEALGQAKSINFLGIGASGSVAQDAYFRFMKLGTCCYALTESSSQLTRVATIGAGDVVVAISHSGRSESIVFATEQSRERGAFTIGITQFGSQPLVSACDVTLFTSARETAFHPEAMASRIAQYALLDSLFIGVALTRYGAVLANLEAARKLTARLRSPTSHRSDTAQSS